MFDGRRTSSNFHQKEERHPGRTNMKLVITVLEHPEDKDGTELKELINKDYLGDQEECSILWGDGQELEVTKVELLSVYHEDDA
jgi:hypothetical protein